jgi:hypothetical protein
VIKCHWKECSLVPGTYYIKLAIENKGIKLDVIEDAIAFEILPADLYGTEKTEMRTDSKSGVFVPRVSWTINGKDDASKSRRNHSIEW